MSVVTRFAPSPSGYLHLGGARTALFNWLYAKHHNGKFFLRIEDTDRSRSTDKAIQQIIDGLDWLNIKWDDEIIFQFQRIERHKEVADKLLNIGRAYRCYCSTEELKTMRDKAAKDGKPIRYDGTWRDKDDSEAPANIKPVIRFKAIQDGETIINDGVQGKIRISNDQIDDMIILRADGTPTYTLSVVVDDHDMGITDAIRGDDHLTNAARQIQLFKAMDWEHPKFSHIPLIHGSDGAKLSKRHGAVAIDYYKNIGVLPDAMNNYLLRLGWAHGDEEIISQSQAINLFTLGGIGKSPSRFDSAKLMNLNAHYLRSYEIDDLLEICWPLMLERYDLKTLEHNHKGLKIILPELTKRTNNIIELIENTSFLFTKEPILENLKDYSSIIQDSKEMLKNIQNSLIDIPWNQESIENTIREFALKNGQKLSQIAKPLRLSLTGSNVSPSIFAVMEALGREEVIVRVNDASKI
tara:strand:+ start:36023 stop:37423 length:1401 start_codon:yes stop_codon:yes gene_type:complete